MNVTITCKTPEDTERIYDLLTCQMSGQGCLSGTKVCTNEREFIPDIMDFDLNFEEIEELKKVKGVASVIENDCEIQLRAYTKTPIAGIPKLCSYTNTFFGRNVKECIPHSLYYCQNYQPIFTHEFPGNGNITGQYLLSTIDCHHVDIIVVDSGVDATHRDFLDAAGTASRVINFNWSLLKEGNPTTGTQIVPSMPANYYRDPNGHGTSCASLAAGNRCGFARNARIFALRANGLDHTNGGFTIDQCLRLVIAFQKAKKLNLHGLVSTRPTICTNSWGAVGPNITRDLNTADTNLEMFAYSTKNGKTPLGSGNYNSVPGYDAVIDGYFRQMLAEGVHCLAAAGNDNTMLANNPTYSIHCHRFFDINTYQRFVIPRTQANNNSYTLPVGGSYTVYGTLAYEGPDLRYFYGSPNVGLNIDKSLHPIIIVGDIIPIGDNDAYTNLYFSAADSKTAFAMLSSTTDTRVVVNATTRYTARNQHMFVKSSYSNFGPDVDVYAPGNATWAAKSNQIPAGSTSPEFTVQANQTYHFMNGTSAATPIAAGILATYLAEYPTKTPTQAKAWLISTSVKNNIMETQRNNLSINSYNGTSTYTVNMPYGATYANVRDWQFAYFSNVGVPSWLGNGNIDEFLFGFRFFDSNNRAVQAHPLRKAVLNNTATTIAMSDTNLKLNTSSTLRVTH